MHEQVVVRESEIDLSQPCSPTINLDTLDNMHSNVYSCFLDASNAFDRVNHYVLFEKLIKRGIPVYIVMILIFWYTTQKMYVRGKISCSTIVLLLTGCVKEELSLLIFCVYMDDLSNKLTM